MALKILFPRLGEWALERESLVNSWHEGELQNRQSILFLYYKEKGVALDCTQKTVDYKQTNIFGVGFVC